MSSVTESVDLAVSVSTAYNQWTQFESFPAFMAGVESVTQTDDTHMHWVVEVAGSRREFDAKITEQLPDERIGWRSADGSHAGLVTFEAIDADNSKVTVQLDWDPEGVLEHLGAAIGSDGRQVAADLHRFKGFIERRGVETGAWRGAVDAPAGGTAS